MKKYTRLVLVLLILTVLVLFCSCGEISFGEKDYLERDGLLYSLADDGLSYNVAGYTDIGYEVTVPAEIDGIPVVGIGNSAFYNATELKLVNLPNSIKKIDDYAFDNCYKLDSIIIPSAVEFIGFSAFSDCTSIKSLVLPNSLIEIESNAFECCSSIESIAIQPALKKIGRDAFEDCKKLSELLISDLGAWCEISFATPESNPLYYADKLYVGGIETKDLVIENIDSISDYAFYKFDGITSLTVGDGVKSIGVSAFSECLSLESVILSDSLERIDTSAFCFCSSLREISFGKSVKKLGGLAFYECASLERVSITDLASWCSIHFYTDNSGTSNPLYYAKEFVVAGESVTDLVIPDGVESISSLAFINFQGIKTVTVPASLKSVADNAFYMCASIEMVTYLATEEMWRSVSIGEGNASFAYAALRIFFA